MILNTSAHGIYEWLTTEDEFGRLLRRCPEVVLHKYVAVTSIDSGFLNISDAQKRVGWHSHLNIAYSPLIQTVDELPRAGFDEWYIFNEPVILGQGCRGNIFEAALQPGRVEVFVNYFGCLLHDTEMRSLADLFWKQIDWIQPESYISDGNTCLTFVSRNKTLFASVREALIGTPAT